jgi:UDP-N-acetyl-D-mannosaminuronic acid dehydrogenase/UDP-N-acetyl-D-glucosamine dehydrogenase
MNQESGRKLVVMGQGYVGIPLAMRAVEAGFNVVGFDVDKARIDCLARGETFIEDVSDSDIAEALVGGKYLPTSDPAALAGFDIAVVSVPTPLRYGAPDLEAVRRAASELAQHLAPGCCVILESTTYPGTTEEVFIPSLQAEGKLLAGEDFHVSYSPERIDPGNPRWKFRSTPKLVSGLKECCTRAAESFYGGMVDTVVTVAGIREAEAPRARHRCMGSHRRCLDEALRFHAVQSRPRRRRALSSRGCQVLGLGGGAGRRPAVPLRGRRE